MKKLLQQLKKLKKRYKLNTMKQLIIILLAFTLTSNAQEVRKKCITITEEKLPNYKVKVIKTNHCVEPKEIT